MAKAKAKKTNGKATKKVKETRVNSDKTTKEVKAKPVKKDNEWTPGSSAQIILEAVRTYGKKGATPDQILKDINGKVKSSNLMGRVRLILRVSVERKLAKKLDDGKTFVALEV